MSPPRPSDHVGETGAPLAVVLAAGAGTRFGQRSAKLRAPFRSGTVLGAAVAAACEADVGPVVVVLGDRALAALLPDGVSVVVNERWPEGLATSLAASLAAAERDGHDAVVVGLGDQPLVGPEAWRRVAASEALVAVATYDGRRRNPVRLARDVWPLLPTTGDEGARALMRQRPELVVEVPCPGEPADIDTADDLARWG